MSAVDPRERNRLDFEAHAQRLRNRTAPPTVTIRILSRVKRELLAEVTVPRPSGRSWRREASSAAVIRWRKERNDWATALVTEVKPEASA